MILSKHRIALEYPKYPRIVPATLAFFWKYVHPAYEFGRKNGESASKEEDCEARDGLGSWQSPRLSPLGRQIATTQTVIDDESLLSALKERDESALRELIGRYSQVVFSLCARMLKNPIDAEEVAADIFSELWQNSRRFEPGRASARTYILMLTRSRCIDRIRVVQREKDRSDRSRLIEEMPGCVDEVPERRAELEELAKLIRHRLNELPEVQRMAIEMSFFDGMTHAEIAETLNTPLGSVKSHIRRGLQRMQSAIACFK